MNPTNESIGRPEMSATQYDSLCGIIERLIQIAYRADRDFVGDTEHAINREVDALKAYQAERQKESLARELDRQAPGEVLTSNVKSLDSRNNLGNIPHMLHNLAAEIERGEEPRPRTMFVVSVLDGNRPPDLFQFGGEMSRLEEVGAFQACIHRVLQIEVV